MFDEVCQRRGLCTNHVDRILGNFDTFTKKLLSSIVVIWATPSFVHVVCTRTLTFHSCHQDILFWGVYKPRGGRGVTKKPQTLMKDIQQEERGLIYEKGTSK